MKTRRALFALVLCATMTVAGTSHADNILMLSCAYTQIRDRDGNVPQPAAAETRAIDLNINLVEELVIYYPTDVVRDADVGNDTIRWHYRGDAFVIDRVAGGLAVRATDGSLWAGDCHRPGPREIRAPLF